MFQKNSDIFNAIKASPNPAFAERDYIECKILDTIFADKSLQESMLFSGGATLTKSYNICPRISHDLDLVICDFTDLPDSRTVKQLKKFQKRFKEFVFDTLRQEINYTINQDKRFMITTDREWRKLHNPEYRISYPTLHILYTSALNNSFEDIRIEITPRLYDTSAISLQYIHPYFLQTPMRKIPTITYEQTFWDKIFALHSIATYGLPRNRFFLSRHYFDVAQIAAHIDIENTYHLFKATEKYQRKYTSKIFAPIDFASNIHLIPQQDTLNILGAEYAKLSNQFLQPPIPWVSIIHKIQAFQSRLNNLRLER